MGMIPLLSVAGLELGPPDFWPMGIGAGTPIAMERVDGPPWRFVFVWTDSGRLEHVDIAWRVDAVAERVSYRWNPDGTIARVESDRSIARPPEEGDVGPDRVRIWEFEHDLPRRVETYFPVVQDYGPTTSWTWSPDRREARLIESAQGNVIEVKRIVRDGDRIRAIETDRGGTGEVDRALRWTWSDDGRLLEVREEISAEPGGSRDVQFEWDDHGRLAGQTTRRAGQIEARFAYVYGG